MTAAPMTPDQIDLVQTTFAAVGRQGDHLVDDFYTRLFAANPALRGMFPKDLGEQKQKLLQTIAYAVNGLKYPDALLPIVRELGERHRGYKVTPRHYEEVAGALIASLAAVLGPQFTPAAKEAWVACYVMIAREMEPAAMA